MTYSQQILARHAGLSAVTAGQLIEAEIDLILANDITAPVAIGELAKHNVTKLHDPSKVVLVNDHFCPPKDIKSAEQCKTVRDFARQHGTLFYENRGIEHTLLPEQGLIQPYSLVIGADSHTCTYGAFGAFSTGVGSTDVAYAMATGKLWFKVPAAIRVNLTGAFKPRVTAKDLILHLIGILGVDGALYQSLEFFGTDMLTEDDKACIANMAIECGGKNAYFPTGNEATVGMTPPDDADYNTVHNIDLSVLKQTVSFPHLPSNTRTVDDNVGDIAIDQVVIGSCTNGRFSDMEAAYEVLSRDKVSPNVRCIIIPGTIEVYQRALRYGYIDTFISAGAIVSTPTCGPCLGGYMGILAAGERCVATTNRNFVGRMGHPESEVYLASPYVAAMSAARGKLVME